MISISRVAIVLALIFRFRFSREIGWKCGGEVGSFHGYGSVIIRDFSDSNKNLEEEAALLNKVVRCGASCLENCL